MRLGANYVISVGAVGPTHALPGARDAGREGSVEGCQSRGRAAGDWPLLLGRSWRLSPLPAWRPGREDTRVPEEKAAAWGPR